MGNELRLPIGNSASGGALTCAARSHTSRAGEVRPCRRRVCQMRMGTGTGANILRVIYNTPISRFQKRLATCLLRNSS